MANICTFLETALLNHVMRNTEYVRPAVVYAALIDDTAVDVDVEAGDLTDEIDGYNEANRPACTFGTAPAQVLGKATIYNTAAVTFTVMPAVTTKYLLIMDGNTKGAGNALYWCPLSPERATLAGDTLTFPIGDIAIDLD